MKEVLASIKEAKDILFKKYSRVKKDPQASKLFKQAIASLDAYDRYVDGMRVT